MVGCIAVVKADNRDGYFAAIDRAHGASMENNGAVQGLGE